jgi:hypothetical protein
MFVVKHGIQETSANKYDAKIKSKWRESRCVLSYTTTVTPTLLGPINQARGAMGTSLDSIAMAVGETADGIDATSDSSNADDDAGDDVADAAAYVDEADAEEGAGADAEEATGSDAEAAVCAPPILLRYSNLANSVCCSALTVGTGSSSLADTAVISSSSEKRLEQLARSGCTHSTKAHTRQIRRVMSKNRIEISEPMKQNTSQTAKTRHIYRGDYDLVVFVVSRSPVYVSLHDTYIRCKGRRHLAALKLLPVDRLEPRMRLDLVQSPRAAPDPMLGVGSKQLRKSGANEKTQTGTHIHQ